MIRRAMKLGLVVLALAVVTAGSDAFGCCWRRCCGWGGCGWGGYYAGCGYGGYGCVGYGYGGWGYPVYGYGYASYTPVYRPVYAPVYASVVSTSRASVRPAVQTVKPTTLTVNVPADAKLFVNDQQMKAQGPRRQFTSRSLKPGAAYNYRVRVEFVRDGQPVSEEKQIQLVAGQLRSLTFAEPATKVASLGAMTW